MKLTTTIGSFESDTGTVPVMFEAEGKEPFQRQVNACFTPDGAYDPVRTADRVAEVGAGVAVKFGLGLVGNPEPEPVAVPEDAAIEAEQPDA